MMVAGTFATTPFWVRALLAAAILGTRSSAFSLITHRCCHLRQIHDGRPVVELLTADREQYQQHLDLVRGGTTTKKRSAVSSKRRTLPLFDNKRLERDIDENSMRRAQEKGGGIGETAAGAVLGGLLLGPFGAFFGASIGSSFGAKNALNRARKEEMEKMGITQEMLDAAQEVGIALERSNDGLKATRDSLETQQQFARRLERDAAEFYEQATKAIADSDEDKARKALFERQQNLDKLKEKKRYEQMKQNVKTIETRAMEIDSLLRRTVGAKATQDSADIGFSLAKEGRSYDEYDDDVEIEIDEEGEKMLEFGGSSGAVVAVNDRVRRNAMSTSVLMMTAVGASSSSAIDAVTSASMNGGISDLGIIIPSFFLPFINKERRQLEVCLVSMLRVLNWAKKSAYRLEQHQQQEEASSTTSSSSSSASRSRDDYLQARLGAKAILSGKVGGGASLGVYTLSTLEFEACCRDLEWYAANNDLAASPTMMMSSAKMMTNNNNNIDRQRRRFKQRFASTIQNNCRDLSEALAYLVEFDGLDTLTDPSPRSSLTISQYNTDKGNFVRRMLSERIIPLCEELIISFDPDSVQRSKDYIRSYYPNEIFNDDRPVAIVSTGTNETTSDL